MVFPKLHKLLSSSPGLFLLPVHLGDKTEWLSKRGKENPNLSRKKRRFHSRGFISRDALGSAGYIFGAPYDLWHYLLFLLETITSMSCVDQGKQRRHGFFSFVKCCLDIYKSHVLPFIFLYAIFYSVWSDLNAV